MIIRQTSLIEVRRTTEKGRGVFATEFIPEGTVFERAPVLVMPAHEVLAGGDETLLSHYLFEWGKKTVAMALGFGSLYNHSYSPNARYEDGGRHIKLYIAVRDIQPGEEITINYNGDAASTEPVWFDVVETDTRPSTASAKAKSDAPPRGTSTKKPKAVSPAAKGSSTVSGEKTAKPASADAPRKSPRSSPAVTKPGRTPARRAGSSQSKARRTTT